MSFFFIFLAAPLSNQNQVLAAPPAEQYRFQDNQTIVGSGGQYRGPVTFKSRTAFKAGSPNTYSTIVFNPNLSGRPQVDNCYLPHMKITGFNNDGSEARLEIETTVGAPQKNPSDCEQKIVNLFHSKPIKIDNSAINTPNQDPETQQQKRVDITLRSPKKSDQSPESIIITVKDAEGTIRHAPTVSKSCTTGDCNTGAVEYKTNLTLDPGTYNVCFSSFEPCHDFTKKIREQLNLYYGESSLDRRIDVLIEVHDVITTGSPYTVSPYVVELKKDGNKVNGCTTNGVSQPPLPGENDAIGGSKKDITVSLRCTLEDVNADKYQVCIITGGVQCKDVEKKPTTKASVTFRVEACGIGLNPLAEKCAPEEEKGPPDGPPPPCPPGKFSGGKCTAFNTAFGDFSTDPAGFLRAVFGILLATSGAIAIILIIRAGYKIMNSQGKPEPLQEGRDQLVAAVVGLIFLIFSFVFLEVIGVDLLRIPGFGGASAPTNPGPGESCQIAYPDPSGGKGNCKTGTCNVDRSTCSGSVCKGTCGESLAIDDYRCLKVFRLGDSGECVALLQEELGLDPADGNYDQRTEDAVRKFQSENGIYADGDHGPCTVAKLRFYDPDPICQGPIDKPTLKQFQEKHNIDPTGEFDICTYTAIIGLKDRIKCPNMT